MTGDDEGKSAPGVWLSLRNVGAAVFGLFSAMVLAGFTISWQAQNAAEHEARQQRENFRLQLQAIAANVETLKASSDLKMSFIERQLQDRMARYEAETAAQNKRIDIIVEHISKQPHKP